MYQVFSSQWEPHWTAKTRELEGGVVDEEGREILHERNEGGSRHVEAEHCRGKKRKKKCKGPGNGIANIQTHTEPSK
jgi:hypothetical protein